MDETFKQLEELSQKYLRNKKLGNEDSQKAEELLKLLFLSANTVVNGYDFMLRLPVESTCKAFVSAWDCETVDGDALVEGLVKNKDFNGVAGRYRLVELIRQFIDRDTRIAFVLLVKLAEILTNTGRKKPDARMVDIFRKKLMDSKELLKIRLGDYGVNPRDISSISALVLMGLINAKDESAGGNKEWKMEFLKWLEQGGSVPSLSASLTSEIEKATAKWPEEVQHECYRMGLIKTIVTRIDVEPQAKRAQTGRPVKNSNNIHISADAGSAFNRARKPDSNKEVEETSELLVHLKTVENYIFRLERKLQDSYKSLNNAQLECDSQRRRLAEQHKLIKELQDKNQGLEHECQRLQEKLNLNERKIIELETCLKSQKIDHKQELEQLAEQMDREIQYNLQEYKNELAESLRILHTDFNDIEDETMTVELGEHLRYAVRKIFRLLKSNGVVFRE